MPENNLKVAVIGLGNVGYEVAKHIAMMRPPEGAKYSIKELILFSTDKKKADISRQILNGLKETETEISKSHASTLRDYSPHIAINCASIPEAKKYSDRRKMGELNLQLNREISSALPEDALEIIVSNHVLTLAQDAVSHCKRDPRLTIGCAHVDSIRAGIAIEDMLAGCVKGKLDKSNIFIIGSHDDNEMVLAYRSSTVNGIILDQLKSLSDKFLDIQAYAGLLAHMQIMAMQTTKELTAKAVTDTLNAVLTEKSYVSAGILCDFKGAFFRADPDYFRFEKPREPVYAVMRAGFTGLKAGFVAGEDKSPNISWFISQAGETKRAFYSVAMKQFEHFKKVQKRLQSQQSQKNN